MSNSERHSKEPINASKEVARFRGVFKRINTEIDREPDRLTLPILVRPVVDFSISQIESGVWNVADRTDIERTWKNRLSRDRRFDCRMLWSQDAIYIRFEGNQSDQLIIANDPNVNKKTKGLWERDACEIFIAPNKSEPRRYFEFEVAPTGEWLDLAIDMTSGERVTDWDYNSGMETAARIEDGRVTMAMKIPWEAFGKKPKTGDVWLGNIFRCVGKEPDRGYLAWRPTMTEKPNFHVPSAFGEFVFSD